MQTETKQIQRWVRVAAIMEITGWDGLKMRWARTNNVVLYREKNGRYEYDINSIPSYFIKTPQL